MMKVMVLTGVSLISSGVMAAKWDKANNPFYFNAIVKTKFTASFNQLPLEARLKDDRLGWSETFWPSNLGGIAYRWNHPDPKPFQYKLHSKQEIMRMSEDELSQLSPSELYDISRSDYEYSLTKIITKGTFPLYRPLYTSKDLWWEGICHGWALAASNYPEPDKVMITNKEGVKVPFGASDVKGLISMHDAYNSKGFYVRVGNRCGVFGKVDGEAFPEDGNVSFPNREDALKPECSDVNAGTFHIVLSNMIGMNSQGFVADVDRFNDVWNQPVVAYSSRVIKEVSLTNEDKKNKVVKKILVETDMIYGDELEYYSHEAEAEGILGFVSKEPVTGTPMQVETTRNYSYILELDGSGKIVGGEWVSESRPDMLWMKAKDPQFLDGKLPLSGLNRIYRPVVH
jgi:hypothetical protein